MTGPLRVGVIGLGVGAQHLAAYAADSRCVVVAACDLDDTKLSGLDEAIRTSTSAADVIDDPDVDLVSIASFDDAHAEQVRRALEAGKHVFAEKPLCRTAEELGAIRAAADASGRRLMSNLVLRAAPLYARIAEDRRAGRLGTIYAFDGDYLYGRLHKITDGWRANVPDYSVMLGGGVHLVDLMLVICGERPARVAAAGNRISTEGTAFHYPDYVTATFEFPSGLIGRISANFGSVHPHHHVVRVFGTEATVLYDDAGARMHRSRDPDGEPELLSEAPLPPGKGALIPAFVGMILQDGQADRQDAGQHEFDLMAACLAADRALKERVTVEIEYP